MKKGFSILEVIFAVAFLVMVGLAMISINAAAVRLISRAELQTVANGLNEESIAVVALAKKANDPESFNEQLASLNCGAECYVNCSTDDLASVCELSAQPHPVQLGRNMLQFVRTVTITPTGTAGAHVVQATVRWGGGVSRESTLSEIIR